MKGHCLFLFVLFVGSWAVPITLEDDLSIYFEHVDTRIVGGSPAPQGSVPYMAILTRGGVLRNLVCGGSIISQRTILTAAHCVAGVVDAAGQIADTILVTVGTNSLFTSGQSYGILSSVIHERYDGNQIKEDIGLLITIESIVLSATVQPVPLTFNIIPGDVEARAAGFGRIVAGGAVSPVLLELTVRTLGGQECVDAVEEAKIEFDRPDYPPSDPTVEICTHHSTGHGMCNGDSGSALVQVSTGHQIGLVSWGFPCALGAPDMFVRVSTYRDWILSNGL